MILTSCAPAAHNNLHSWVSDDGWLWSISKRKTGGIPRVFRGFFALKSAVDGRQLAPNCASYFLTGPKLDFCHFEGREKLAGHRAITPR